MAEQLKTVSLKCSGCGASLDIEPDVEQFACGYCGAGQLVQRKGGMVLLKPLTAAIAKVQAGTDRTAAELALIRLDGDLKALIAEREKHTNETDATIDQIRKKRFVGLFWGTTFLAWPIGAILCMPFFDSGAWAVFGLIIGLAVGQAIQNLARSKEASRLRTALSQKLKPIDSQISAVQDKIRANQATVDS